MVDSSSSVLFSQDCFGYSGSFVFPYELCSCCCCCCSSTVKKCHFLFDRDYTESVDCVWQYSHFHNIDSSYPGTQNISPSVFVIFDFFNQCLMIFCVQFFFVSLGKFIARYLILFVAMVNGIDFLTFLIFIVSIQKCK